MLFKREILKYCNSKNSLVVHFEFWGINRLNTNKKKNTLSRCVLKYFFLKPVKYFARFSCFYSISLLIVKYSVGQEEERNFFF